MKGGPWSNRQKVARFGKGKYTDPQGKNDHYNKPIEEQERIEHARRVKMGKAAVKRWDKSTGGKSSSKGSSVGSKPKTPADIRTSKEVLDLTKRFGGRGPDMHQSAANTRRRGGDF